MKIKIIPILLQIIFFTFALNAAGLGSFGGAKQQKFLVPAEAFKVNAVDNGKSISVDIILADKIYMYKKDLHFSITAPINLELLPTLPEADMHGKDKIFRSISVEIPLKDINDKVNGEYNLTVEMTGCSDAGICYSPQQRTFEFESKSKISQGIFDKMGSLIESGNAGKIVDVLVNENIFFILFLFFVAGLLLALTPCILPMVPILSSIILQQAKKDGKVKRGTAFVISLVYVISMALTYALIGVVAGLFEIDLAANLNNPWVIIPFAALFVALALSLFGLFELALPASWQSKLTKASSKAEGKGLVGTAIMGSLSALIVGACTAPVISGAIIFIATTGEAALGGMSLFMMGLGAGMPLLLIGAGADKMVPKPGGWMNVISKVFGLMMLIVALYVLSRLLPMSVTMFLASLIAMGTAIYMGIFDSAIHRVGPSRLITLLGVISFIYGVFLFAGCISGSGSIMHPLDQFTSSKSSNKVVIEKEDRSSRLGYNVKRLEDEIANANKPVVVDIGKDGCAACLELENITFVDSAVAEEMKRFKFIQINMTKYTKQDQEIMKKYNIFGAPNILFFDSNGKPVRDKFLTGFRKPKLFLEDLKSIK